MSHSVAKPDHGTPIGFIEGDPAKPVLASDRIQLYLDELEEKLNTNLIGGFLVLESYVFADLPTVPDVSKPSVIFVSDLSGQPAPVYSDGTNWRRFSDDTVAS